MIVDNSNNTNVERSHEIDRGETDRTCGFCNNAEHFLIGPTSEKAEEFLLYLNLGNQTFLSALLA